MRVLSQAIANNRDVQQQMRRLAEEKLAAAKSELISEFENHPVTQEIQNGASANNSSGTLGGYGNLFSFIGFDSSSSPISAWVSFLNRKIALSKSKPSGQRTTKNGFELSFSVNSINENEMVSNAGMPWEGGRSWITAIERGISGFSYFITKKLGRSGGGVQSDKQLRSSSYKRQSYWSPMWKKFINNLNQ